MPGHLLARGLLASSRVLLSTSAQVCRRLSAGGYVFFGSSMEGRSLGSEEHAGALGQLAKAEIYSQYAGSGRHSMMI